MWPKKWRSASESFRGRRRTMGVQIGPRLAELRPENGLLATCPKPVTLKRKTGGRRAHCPPATSVRARLVAQALKPTARGYRGQSPVCTWACHGPTGPRRRGEGIEGARTYIPTPGCMRERFIIGAPTSALFLQPRKKTQATSRGNKLVQRRTAAKVWVGGFGCVDRFLINSVNDN